MERKNKILITDKAAKCDFTKYDKRVVLPPSIEHEYAFDLIKEIIKGQYAGYSADVRTEFLSLNNMHICGTYIVANMKTITAGQLNAQKNEIMRGWQLQEPEYIKPWWRFW